MDGPTLITQPPGYPEERPETDDMDGMLDHIADELEGKQMLEKPRVSKKASRTNAHEAVHAPRQMQCVGPWNFFL